MNANPGHTTEHAPDSAAEVPLRNLVLIGPMGTGKTTIGRLAASELGWVFVDTDKEIEARCGADIPWIFDVEGEAGFRARETAVLAEMLGREQVVIATGGGVVSQACNRELLEHAGHIVYLHTSAEQQYERTRQDTRRPLLQTADPLRTLRRLMAEREPHYRALAHFTVDTDRKRPRNVAKDIAGSVRLHFNMSCSA
ncbi:shikimate kinase [Allohahella marinimesophila]|uniref:Shikimate kinase n=1 Tax=Allohahella marinimesophila TaxID=1054972 RepID=A0ABP7PUH6_9GAMM